MLRSGAIACGFVPRELYRSCISKNDIPLHAVRAVILAEGVRFALFTADLLISTSSEIVFSFEEAAFDAAGLVFMLEDTLFTAEQVRASGEDN